MNNELLIAVFAGLGGMLGWGFADFFAKKTIDDVGDVVSLVWGHIFGTLSLCIFVGFRIMFFGYNFSIPTDSNIWTGLVFFGILQAAVYYFVFKAFSKGQVSLLSPIFASFAGITALFSILIFGEIVSVNLVLAIIVIFAGILLINLDITNIKEKSIFFTKISGLKEIIIATLLASVWTLLWGKFVSGQDWLSYSLLMYGFMTLAIIILAKFQKIGLQINKPNIWKFLFLIGFGEVLAYLAISFGYSNSAHLSIIALLSGAFSLPVIVLSHILLKERVTTFQRIGSLIIVLGIMFLAIP